MTTRPRICDLVEIHAKRYLDEPFRAIICGRENGAFSVFIQGHGPVSWFRANEMTVLARDQAETLDKWQDEYDEQDYD